MPASRTYADYNATAPLRPEAKAAMLRAMEGVGNASSVHAEGRAARAQVEAARDVIAAAIGACRDDLAFTSGGTEAVQAPLKGALAAVGLGLIVSPIEHDAAMALAPPIAAHMGLTSEPKWEVGADGVVDLGSLKSRVKAMETSGLRPLVSLMLVNNETGVIQPVAEAAEIVHAAGGLIHCDAIQALGKIPVSVIELDVDYLSISSHKIGGPTGAGAIYVKPGAPFRAVQTGGGQEFGRRSGTEDRPAIAGFAAAVEAIDVGAYAALAPHRDAMEAKLKTNGVVVHGEQAARVAGVSCFGLDGWLAETQVMAMDLAGFAVSAGSACSSGKVKPSRVLTAMGATDTAARSAIRASFGWASTANDFDALANAWLKAAARARPQLVKA